MFFVGICLLSVVLTAIVVVSLYKQIRVLKREIKLLNDNEKKLLKNTCVSLLNNAGHGPERQKPYENVDDLQGHSRTDNYDEITGQ